MWILDIRSIVREARQLPEILVIDNCIPARARGFFASRFGMTLAQECSWLFQSFSRSDEARALTAKISISPQKPDPAHSNALTRTIHEIHTASLVLCIHTACRAFGDGARYRLNREKSFESNVLRDHRAYS